MRTIQAYLKECNRERVIGSFMSRYLSGILTLSDRERSIKEIIDRLTEKLNGLIDRLISAEPVPGEERMIFMASHCFPDDDGDDIWFMLLKESELDNEEWAQPYAFELIPFKESISYYVADTYLTQYEINDLLAHFLHEVAFTGYEQEYLEDALNKIEDATMEAEEHKDDPDYFISHEELKAMIEEEFDFEFEKPDPAQEEAWKKIMKHVAAYNRECQQIELAKLRELVRKERQA